MGEILDLSPLENAVAQLDEALGVYHSDLVLLEPRLKRLLRLAVIQALEFTYLTSRSALSLEPVADKEYIP